MSSLFFLLVLVLASLQIHRGSCKYTHLSLYGQVPTEIKVLQGSCLNFEEASNNSSAADRATCAGGAGGGGLGMGAE
jgi:hypothetical protein